MSSIASATIVELPRWPWADRLSVALALAAGVVVEAVLARYPDAPAGMGAAVAALLALTTWVQRRDRPHSLEFTAGACRLRFPDSREAPFVPGPGCRLLADGVVLHWLSPDRSGILWLTPLDLSRETLRALAVRLVSGR